MVTCLGFLFFWWALVYSKKWGQFLGNIYVFQKKDRFSQRGPTYELDTKHFY